MEIMKEGGGDSPAVVTVRDFGEKKEPSLGESNALLLPPDLLNAEAIEALATVTKRKIDQIDGILPDNLEVAVIPAFQPVHRFLARFTVPNLAPEQLDQLEEVVRQAYQGQTIKTRKNTNSGNIDPSFLQPLSGTVPQRKANIGGSKYLGWQMGPDLGSTSSTSFGLYVYRYVNEKAMAGYLKEKNWRGWFFEPQLTDPMGKVVPSHYLVEIREAALYQTDLVEFIVQTASILAGKGIQDPTSLKYEVYNNLNRLGLKRASQETVYGLDEQIEEIRRSLILPLSNRGLSKGIGLKPESVLLIGVPGVGKTLLVEQLLQEDTGIFIVPLDPRRLADELSLPVVKQAILPRISAVMNQTGIPVVLHMDDIENIAGPDQPTNAAFLNLMAGVRDNDIYVIGSTNYPEKINPQLLQPERFGRIIYFGLPPEEARYRILNIHTPLQSQEGLPLFNSTEDREAILRAIAANTENFSSRRLADISNTAKTYLLRRLTLELDRQHSLSQQDLKDYHFSIEDWVKGLFEAKRRYDSQAEVTRDKQIRDFARQFNRGLGLVLPTAQDTQSVILKDFETRIAAFKTGSTTN